MQNLIKWKTIPHRGHREYLGTYDYESADGRYAVCRAATGRWYALDYDEPGYAKFFDKLDDAKAYAQAIAAKM